MYAPPLNIRVFDKRKFGYAPLVGQCIIYSLNEYMQEASPREGSSALTKRKIMIVIYLNHIKIVEIVKCIF